MCYTLEGQLKQLRLAAPGTVPSFLHSLSCMYASAPAAKQDHQVAFHGRAAQAVRFYSGHAMCGPLITRRAAQRGCYRMRGAHAAVPPARPTAASGAPALLTCPQGSRKSRGARADLVLHPGDAAATHRPRRPPPSARGERASRRHMCTGWLAAAPPRSSPASNLPQAPLSTSNAMSAMTVWSGPPPRWRTYAPPSRLVSRSADAALPGRDEQTDAPLWWERLSREFCRAGRPSEAGGRGRQRALELPARPSTVLCALRQAGRYCDGGARCTYPSACAK